MGKQLKKKNTNVVKVEVVELDGEKRIIGTYNKEKKLFSCTRKKSEHFMRKWNAWGLDKNTTDFLAVEQATIHLKDLESKWEYECSAIDMKLSGKLEEHSKHRAQYFLPINMWKLVTVKNKSMVVECLEKDCTHNFGLQCVRGVIKINSKGECDTYEDRQS